MLKLFRLLVATLALAAGCDPVKRGPSSRRGEPDRAPAPVLPPAPVGRTAVLLQTSGGEHPILLPVACWDAPQRRFAAGADCHALVPLAARLAAVTITGRGEATCREVTTAGFTVAAPRELQGEYVLWPAALQPGLVRPESSFQLEPDPTGPNKKFLPPGRRFHPEPTDAERPLLEATLAQAAGRPVDELWFAYDVFAMDLDGDAEDERLIVAQAHPRPSGSGEFRVSALYLVTGSDQSPGLLELERSRLHRVWGLVGFDLDGDGRREIIYDVNSNRAPPDPDDGATFVLQLTDSGPRIVARFQSCPPVL